MNSFSNRWAWPVGAMTSCPSKFLGTDSKGVHAPFYRSKAQTQSLLCPSKKFGKIASQSTLFRDARVGTCWEYFHVGWFLIIRASQKGHWPYCSMLSVRPKRCRKCRKVSVHHKRPAWYTTPIRLWVCEPSPLFGLRQPSQNGLLCQAALVERGGFTCSLVSQGAIPRGVEKIKAWDWDQQVWSM